MLQRVLEVVCADVIRGCALKYNFSEEEALGVVSLKISVNDGREMKVSKPKIPLPFTGHVWVECCSGLRQNHGLLTQCQKKKEDSKEYCSGCEKQAEKNASGKPNSGNIEDRLAAYESGKEYRDPKGKAPTAYAKVMQKLKLSEEVVEAEAVKQNIELPSDIFNKPVAKRGRPKKNMAVTSDTDSEKSEPKRRGRPKKTGKPVEVSTTEDLFASLISEAKANSPRPAGLPKAEAKQREEKVKPKVEEEEEVKVKKFEFKGKVYYRTSDNVLYDPKTQDCVGVFNEERQEIDECEEDEDEEDEDE
jgi:antirestriction protein